MKIFKRHSVKLYIALAVAGLATLYLWPALVAAMPVTARHNLERALMLAADVGQYDYQSTVLRTKHPTLTLGNVGRTAATEQFVIEGELDRPADLMTMNIAVPNQPPMEVKLEQGRAYGRMEGVDGMEEWTEVEAGSDLFAPGGDPLGFLNIVENVRRVDQNGSHTTARNESDDLFPAEMLPVAMADSISRYQFDVSGPKYARQMRTSLEQALHERGELPAGISLQTPQQYVDLTGHGEIWISDNGLPLRQIVRLEFPPEPGADVWVEAEITTTFSNWQDPGLTYALLNVIPRVVDDPSILTSNPLALFPNLNSQLSTLNSENLQTFGLLLGLSLLLVALAIMAITHRRSPKFYAALSLSIIAMMLVTPLLQSQQVHAATTRFHARQAEAEQQQAETAAQTEEAAPTFNPNQNPLDKVSPPPNLPAVVPVGGETIASPPLEGTIASPPLGGIEGGLPTDNLQLTIANSADSPIPNPHAFIPQLQTGCVITEDSDCDGDGLTDNIEIYELGTWVDHFDTDNDGISDQVEVTPFQVGSRNWYLDPRKADSNGDGQLDRLECPERVNVLTTTLRTDLTPGICSDTDSDGTPDVFDFDNDGDGVPDTDDLSPYQVQTIADDNNFNLSLTNVSPDTSLFVDLQIRPVDSRQLWWKDTVYNWPNKDTQGQIQRVTDETLTSEGDMMLSPVLQVVMPYAATNPSRGLPVISGTTIITASTPLTSWLDLEETEKYGLTISQGENNDLVMIVPLTIVQDTNGQSPVAFGARIPYILPADSSGWGAAHQITLLWAVSAVVDECQPPQGQASSYCSDYSNWTSTKTVIQTYPGQFNVTGLVVQENHGVDAALIAQAPSAGGSNNYPSRLWHLADTLQEVLLAGQTVSDNRFAVSDIDTHYPNWGIPTDDLVVQENLGLANQIELFDQMSLANTDSFLSGIYNGNDTMTAIVLYAYEETVRTRSMGEQQYVGNVLQPAVTFQNNTFSVDFADAELLTTASLGWKPFVNSGAGWGEVDISTYIDQLFVDLDPVFDNEVLTQIAGGTTPNDLAKARSGAILMAQTYYLSNFISLTQVVAQAGQVLENISVNDSEHSLPSEPIATILGAITTEVGLYYERLNLNAGVNYNATWADLAVNPGSVLTAFGDVAQGVSSSSSLALVELTAYGDLVTDKELLTATTLLFAGHAGAIKLANGPGFTIPDQLGQLGGKHIGGEALSYVVQGATFAVRGFLTTIYIYNFIKATQFAEIIKNSPGGFAGASKVIQAQQGLEKIKLGAKVNSVFTIVLATGTAVASIVGAATTMERDSAAFTRVVAEGIALVTLAVIQVAVTLALAATGIGVLIFAVIGIIDAIIGVICVAADVEKGGAVDRWICGGIMGALKQAFAYVINDSTPLVQLDHDNILDSVFYAPSVNQQLTNPAGYVVGNQLNISATITTTLYMGKPKSLSYAAPLQMIAHLNDDTLEDASFEYRLQTEEKNHNVDLDETTWISYPGKTDEVLLGVEDGPRFYQGFPVLYQYTLDQAGINAQVPIYLSQSFAIPQQNCWYFLVTVQCFLNEYDDNAHVDLSNDFVFDILPSSVDAFRALASAGDDGYRLAWDEDFPAVVDLDGDGLRSKAHGGNDPDDSTPDTDADGLGDYYELAHEDEGYDPTEPDGDCDGLTDYWENVYGTNPALADTDGDGLRDGEEVFHPNRIYPYENHPLSNANPPLCSSSAEAFSGGWEFVYDFDDSNNPLSTWVSADPLSPDTDGDGLTDLQERIYAYNPHVSSTLDVLALSSSLETNSNALPFVSPSGSITYTAAVSNQLTLPYARGLLETELPLDNVLRTQPLGIIAPGGTVNTSGVIDISETGIATSREVKMGVRAGAILDDPTGRALWLHLNELANSTTFVDTSYLQNNGTCSGNSCPTATGTSLTFDGDDAIIVPDSDDLDLNQYTIALAVKPTTTGSNRILLRKGESATNRPATYDLHLLLELSANNKLHFLTYYNDCVSRTGNRLSTPALLLNEWSHITASYDGSTKKLYLNGRLVASTSYNRSPCLNNDPLTIGAGLHSGNLFGGFTGQIDEVEIFSSVLNEADVLANYANPLLQLDLSDDDTWGSDAVSCADATCPAASGSGATFDQTEYLSVTAPDLSNDAFAFATWIKPESRSTPLNAEVGAAYGKDTDRDWQGVFGNFVYDSDEAQWPRATTIYPSLFVSDDGALRMTMGNNGQTCQITTNNINLIQNDVWQHVAVSYDGSNFTFYVNGKAIGGGVTGTSCAGITPPSVSDFYIGRPNNYGYAWADRIEMTSIADENINSQPAPRLNLNDDGAAGNIWAGSSLDNGVYQVNQEFFVQDSNQWLRLWEADVDGATYQPVFAGTAPDRYNDNWKQLTNISNITYLGLTGYDFVGPNQANSVQGGRYAAGTFYFGVFNDYFQGQLDDFRVYDYAINDGVALDLYNGTLVALDMPFDEAPGADLFGDESGNYVTVSCSGDTCPLSGIPGRLNQALEFDGLDDYLTIGTASAELGTSKKNFSVMMWIKPDDFRGTYNIGQVPLIEVGNEYGLGLYGYGGLGVGGPPGIASTDRLLLYNDTRRWYHLAYVFDRGIYTFYVNGENVGSDTLNKPGNSDTLRIGRNRFDAYYDGLLDDLTIVKRSLTQAEVQAHFNRAPAVNLHLDEDLSLTSFADDSENRYTATCNGGVCPSSGDKGQIREAVTFDGDNDFLVLADSKDLALTDFSVGLWVKPTKTINAPQYLLAKSTSTFFRANARLWLLNDSMTVRFDRQSSCAGSDTNWHTVDAANPLIENQWNHVLATHDSVNGQMALYINGTLAGSDTGTGSNVCTDARPIRLGKNFNGALDEVTVFRSVLDEDAVAALYNYQASWFDVIEQHGVVVDADNPVVDLGLLPSHVSNSTTIQIRVDAAQTLKSTLLASPIASVLISLNGGPAEEVQNNNGWLYYFDPGPTGSYTVDVTAIDQVGNVSTASTTIVVEKSGPSLEVASSAPQQVKDSLEVSGTVNDGQSDAQSGVEENSLYIRTIDHQGLQVGGNYQADVNQDGTWTATQPFITPPYGIYTVTARAEDKVGNRTTAAKNFLVDGLPPYADITDNQSFIRVATPKTMTGIASDVPHLADSRTLHLHFEDGLGVFVDGSKNKLSLDCTIAAGDCPTTGITGRHGQAVSFDGVNDLLSLSDSNLMTAPTPSDRLGLKGGSFTVMSWVNAPAWSGDQAIIGSSPITPTAGFYLGLQNGRPILGYEGNDTAMPNAIPTGEWVHLAWRFDSDSGERAFFVNGSLSYTSTGHLAYSLADDIIELGRARGGNAYGGSLDELVIYAQPLPDETIYDIANPLDIGVTEMELRIRSYEERNIGQFEGIWNPVSLDNVGQLFTTWDYTLPALAAGGYKIDLRVTDEVGNSSFVDGAWDFAVVAPNVTISKQSAITLAQTSQTISYTISYTNASPAPATGVVITEIVPVDTTFDPTLSHPNWTCLPDGSAGSACTFALGNLAANASETLTFTVTVTDSWSAGTTHIDNTVTIGTDGVDSSPADNSYNHQIPIDGGVDLEVSIEDDGTAFQHDPSGFEGVPPMVYTITYTNSGTQPAQPQLTVDWSDGGDVGPAGSLGWSCTNREFCTQALGNLDINQSGTVTFALRTSYYIPDDQLITTTVEIEDLAGGTEIITANNTASVVSPIDLDYAVVPEFASLTVQEGQAITNGVELLVPPETDLAFLLFQTLPPPSAGEFFDRSFTGTAEDLTWQWIYTATDGIEQTQPVTWYVTIGEGSFTVQTVFSMTVENVAPTVAITGNDTIASGALYSLTLGGVIDPGDDTVTACTLDWGDGNNEDCFGSLGGGSLSHTYGSDYANPTITVNLTDEDGTHVAASKTITVTGLSTSLEVDLTSVTAYESQTVTNSGTYSPADATFTWSASEGIVTDDGNGVWSWSLDAGSAESTRPVTITADSQNITFDVTVQGDGVASNIEAGAPNSGDGNDDGVPDQAQMHVASLPSPLTGDYVTLVASPGMTLTNVSLTAAPAAGDGSQPPGLEFPLGYLEFDLTGMGSGGNTNVTLLISGTTSLNSYGQYDSTNGWTTFLYENATETGAELVSNQRIILYLVDGDRGDGDGSANGTVANLGGPATQQQPKTLTVNISGSGSVSPPAGAYAQGTVLTMEATPDPGWTFSSWSGALSGSAISQTLTMNQDKSVTAIFGQESYTLVDQVVGGGSISLDPDQSNYLYGDVVTATATPDPGWSFDGWSGDLSGGTMSETLTIDGNTSITAIFTQDSYTVTATTNGTGSVTLNPQQSSYVYGDQIAVAALPDPGYTFQGWSGDLSSDAPLENLTIDGNKSITALFATAVYSVETSVLGSGSITLEPDQATYSYGDVVTATATPAAGWSLSEWQLGLSGITATQSLTITGNTTLLAVFEAESYTLNAAWDGDGGVIVAPDQSGYSYGEVVTATAVPNTGSTFVDWSGSISDTALTTTVTMTGDQSILATFAPITYTLTVAKAGSGSGTVSATESIIDCGSDCSEPLDYGSVISLTATPDPGSTFDGWAGPGIANSDLFTVTISGATVVTATFGGGIVNDLPALDPIGPQTIDEGETLTFTATATDTGVPTQTLSYQLSQGPSGAILGTSSGQFSWLTTEEDGPGVYTATVVVSDGVLTDSETIQITVNEINEAPVLTFIPDQTVLEGETVSFTATATDSDVPTQTLSYNLSGEPNGAVISPTTGLFTWPTDADDGPGVYTATIIVSDGALTDSQTIAITVTEESVAPVLGLIEAQTITETETLTFTAVATDANGDTLTYGLSNPSTGMTLDPDSGLFSWTPTEGQGPSSYFVSLIVTDTSGLTDTAVVEVSVTERNEAPALAALSDQTLLKSEPFSLTLTATDPDLPANSLSYTLTPTPTGAGLVDNLFTWTPTETGVYSVTFIVSDDGSPVLTDSQTITLTVTDRLSTTLSGSVTLQGRPPAPDARWSVPLSVKLYQSGQITPSYEMTTTTDSSGYFTLTAAIPPGDYDIAVKNSHTLQNIRSATLVTGTNGPLDFGTLRAGDVNDDNLIGLSDFSLLATAFNTQVGDPEYDDRADLNGDGFVELSDFSLLASNFNVAGDEPGTGPYPLVTASLPPSLFATQPDPLTALTVAEESVSLLIQPATQRVQVGEIFTVAIRVEAGDQPVDGVETHLDFDPTLLKLISVTEAAAELLPVPLLAVQFDNQTGTLDAAYGTFATAPSGSFPFLTLEFEALAPTSGSELTFADSFPRRTQATFQGNNVLEASQPGTVIITEEDTAPTEPLLYLSTTRNGTVAGLPFADEDILVYDPNQDKWDIFFDGSDVGLRGTDLYAFYILEDGSLLLTLDRPKHLPGLGRVDDSDIVRFIPTTLGETTSGSFEWYLDGSDVGLSRGSEDVDSIALTSEGDLLLSTIGHFRVPGIGGRDEDLIRFVPTSLGEITAGTWERYFDGSDVGLRRSGEDVRDSWLDPDSGDIYLTTKGNFATPELSGEGADIFICTPDELGATTRCTFGDYWAGADHGLASNRVDGFFIDPQATDLTETEPLDRRDGVSTLFLPLIVAPGASMSGAALQQEEEVADVPEEEDIAADDAADEADSDQDHDLDDVSDGSEDSSATFIFLPLILKAEPGVTTQEATPLPTATPGPTGTPLPSPTPDVAVEPSATPEATQTPGPEPTATPEPSVTATATLDDTVEPPATPTPAGSD